MARTLGLDIGTNSIGWCLVEDGSRIVAMGSRIFPVGVKEDTYAKSGTEESRNAARRAARSIRRGYDRHKQRRRELEALLSAAGMMFDKTVSLPAKQFYGLRRKALDERIDLKDLGRILFLFNQRRGFKSNRKDAAKQGDAEKELEGMLGEMSRLEQQVKERGARTVGEYFASLFDDQPVHWHNPNEPLQRIRHRHVNRKLYEAEFDMLWAAQARFYPDVLTEELRYKIRDRAIFFQRRLKSAKHLVAKCRFEPEKHVMPKSHPLFQDFRIWQKIRDIRVTYSERVNEYLTNEERATLAAELGSVRELSEAGIKRLLGWPRSASLNDIGGKLKGATTTSAIAKAVGEQWYGALPEDKQFQLWHTLYFATDDGWLERYAKEKLGMNDEQAEAYLKVRLEPDYGSISHKAAKRILPHLMEGHDYATACELAGYHHSYNEEEEGKDRPLAERINTAELEPMRNPLVQMCVNETARTVNAIVKAYGRPETVRVELLRDLKKPKAVREGMRKRLLDKEKLRDEHRRFLRERLDLPEPTMSDLKKFELWLEMEWSESELSKLRPGIDLDAFRKFAERANSKDGEKYKLWLECGRISPYTGNIIPLGKLFTEEIHVEHIIPYSRCLDDSFMNKTLAEQHVNDEKGNLTPLEYYAQKRSPDELKAFKERVKHFGDGKKDKFLATEVKDDFLNSQFTNSAYIGTEVRKMLRRVVRDVRVTNGQLTALMRGTWKLNELLNNAKDQKNRDDHRHHAVDALVIACTTQTLLQKVSTASSFDHRGRQRVADVGVPWPKFRLEAAEHLNGMLVSYRNGKRLLSSKLNKYRYSKAHTGHPEKWQRTVAVRGPLHEETLYGSIQDPNSREEAYVVRRSLTALTDPKQLENVVDAKVREVLKARLAEFGGNMKEAFRLDENGRSPVVMYSKDPDKRIPIRHVRMVVNTEQMVELRPGTFVEPGSNYCMAIYEDERGRRAFRTVSFLEAARNALERKPLYPAEVDGKRLLMVLQQKDLVILYRENPEEIEWNSPQWLAQHLYVVKKFDRTGVVGLVLHKASNVNTDYPKKYPLGTTYKKTSGSLRAVPVTIDVLGRITKRQ